MEQLRSAWGTKIFRGLFDLFTYLISGLLVLYLVFISRLLAINGWSKFAEVLLLQQGKINGVPEINWGLFIGAFVLSFILGFLMYPFRTLFHRVLRTIFRNKSLANRLYCVIYSRPLWGNSLVNKLENVACSEMGISTLERNPENEEEHPLKKAGLTYTELPRVNLKDLGSSALPIPSELKSSGKDSFRNEFSVKSFFKWLHSFPLMDRIKELRSFSPKESIKELLSRLSKTKYNPRVEGRVGTETQRNRRFIVDLYYTISRRLEKSYPELYQRRVERQRGLKNLWSNTALISFAFFIISCLGSIFDVDFQGHVLGGILAFLSAIIFIYSFKAMKVYMSSVHKNTFRLFVLWYEEKWKR